MSLLAYWIERHAALRPRASALALTDARLSYADLRDRARGSAQTLAGHGVGAGEVLAVASASPSVIALAAYAASHLGAALFPLDPRAPAARLQRLLACACARHVVADESPADGVTWIRSESMLRPARPVQDAPPVAAPGDPEAIELLVATSGSSGEPKAVMLPVRSIEASAGASAARIPLGGDDSWIACLPLFHVGGMAILHRCARAGAAVRLHERFDPKRVLEELAAGAATHVSLVPAMLAAMLDAWDGKPLPAKCLLVGGAALSPVLARRALSAGWPVYVSYGLSETASQVATARLDALWRPGRIGLPLEGVRVELVGDGGDRPGIGRIRVQGQVVMAGYANVAGERGHGLADGAFLTADLGRIEDDGTLSVLGRADEVLITGGENVCPGEVETLLLECPGVEEAAVTARSDAAWGDRLVAFVVGSAEESFVEGWCRERLPAPWRPRSVFKLAALPRNAMRKLDRSALRRMAGDDRFGAREPA